MMRKLLKHEFIATGRIMGIIYAVVALIMGYVLISYFAGNREEATVGQMLGLSVLMIVSMCMFVLTAVIMVTNFQKTLYGDQGYLSFTLPVKSVSLLTSKVLASTVWFLAAFACMIGTMALLLFVLKEDWLGDDYDTIASVLPLLLEGRSIATIVTYVLIKLISLFVSFGMFTVEVYFAITIANTRPFQKHYILWTLIFSVAIIAITEKIAMLIADAVQFGLVINGDSVSIMTKSTEFALDSMPLDLVSVLMSVVFGAVFFYGTFFLMSKKVNIR